MKTFNSIQIVALLAATPSLLEACYDWNRTIFWVGSIMATVLVVFATFLIRLGMDDGK